MTNDTHSTHYLTIALVILTLAIAGVGAYAALGTEEGGQTAQDAGPQWGAVSLAEDGAIRTANSSTSATSSEGASATAQETSAAASSVAFDTPKEFSHPKRNFSFRYPSDLNVGRFDQSGGEMIVVQDPDRRVGFQIFIQQVDENIKMSKARIQEDLPNLEVREPRPVQLGANAGQGLAFLSDNQAFGGNSREVWFTFGGYLYQISTYASLDPLMKQVLNSWEFQ